MTFKGTEPDAILIRATVRSIGMFKRIREIFESIAFAGMKPGGAPVTPSHRMKWLGSLREPIDRFISGGPAPTDPLYLTNRTWGQKLRFATVVAVPCLVVGGLMTMALSNYWLKKTPEPTAPTPADLAKMAARMLPNMETIKLDTNKDVDVIDVHIDHSRGVALAGTVLNNTKHSIPNAEIVFDLTDESGSQLGGVSTRIENLAAQIRQEFRLPIEQSSAKYALVREIRTH